MRLSDPDPETARTAAIAAVGVAAGLLITVAGLGLRIAKHSQRIKESLEVTRDETQVLWEIPNINFALADITAELRRLRTGAEA